MNQQLFPASFRSKPFSLSTTETCLSLLRDPASCKNGWQSRRLSSAAGHGSLFNVQSKQMTISHTQFLSYDDSSNCCAFVTCAWNHWPHTHCRHVLKKKHCLPVASCPVQNYQHQCALRSALSSSPWSNAISKTLAVTSNQCIRTKTLVTIHSSW